MTGSVGGKAESRTCLRAADDCADRFEIGPSPQFGTVAEGFARNSKLFHLREEQRLLVVQKLRVRSKSVYGECRVGSVTGKSLVCC